MTEEMIRFRELLDKEGIEWKDASDKSALFPITRTHFTHRGYNWSVVHGYGTYGGFRLDYKYGGYTLDMGLLELMSNAVDGGDPVGWLSADGAMELVNGGHNLKENKLPTS